MSRVNAPGRLVGSGRYADVYDIGRGRVLRRYRDATAVPSREAEVMTHARAHGVPVPEVFASSGTDIIMEYARGPTMLQVLTRRPWTLRHHARLLADLHALVHAVPVLGWLRAPFGAGSALLHLDLHPDNVILAADGPRLIDWQGAAQGPAEADLALTWVLVASGQIPGPLAQQAVGRGGQALFARSYLAAAGPVAPGWLISAARHRLKDPSLRAAEAVRITRLLRSARLTDRTRR
jgi:aminoglycoside phosphotransferase (APT) family kinase protein